MVNLRMSGGDRKGLDSHRPPFFYWLEDKKLGDRQAVSAI